MAYMNGKEVLFSTDVTIASPEVVQTTGDSETAVMSQKAVTALTLLNANVIIGSNGTLYLEEKNNICYIKPLRKDGATGTIGIYSYSTPERILQWSEITTTLATKVVTSPKGVEDCLQINGGQAFVYDITTDKVVLQNTYNLRVEKYITLFFNNYGLIGGKLNEIRNRYAIDEAQLGLGAPAFIHKGYLYIENASNSECYIKPYINDLNTTHDICLYSKQLGGYSAKFTWESVCEQFSSRVQTSPKGIENCLLLGAEHTLVYNVQTLSLQIVNTTAIDIAKHIVLFGYYYGEIHGCLLEHNNRWAWKDIEDINAKLDNIWTGMPDYYADEIVDTKSKLSVLPADNFNYLVITDLHNSHSDFTHDRLRVLVESIVNIANSSNIDAVVCLGDLIEGGMNALKSTSKAEMMEIVELLGNCRKPVLFAYGNHDQNAYNWAGSDTTDHYILLNEWVNMCVRPFINKNDYYAVDFEDKGIRLIVANTSDYDEVVDDSGNVDILNYSAIKVRDEQLDDICDMLNDTQHNIIVCGHALPTNLLDLLKAFNMKGTYTKSNGDTINFSGKTNRIILYNFGHYHNEAFEYVSAYDLNMFSSSCGSLASIQQNYWTSNDILSSWKNTDTSEVERVKGEISEACYYVLSIGDGKINKINFGAGEDGVLTI